MKRTAVIVAVGGLLGTFGAMVAAAPTLARGPKWQFANIPTFTLPAALCGFKIQVTPVVDKSYFKVLKTSDGSTTFLSTGQAKLSFTNLQTRKTITEGVSGPAKPTVFPNGSLTEVAGGHNLIILSPADAKRFGLPTVSVTVGRIKESFAPNGTITSLSLQGHVLVNVCSALS
jgi:hypothetical protein